MSWRCEKCWGVSICRRRRRRVMDGIDGEEIESPVSAMTFDQSTERIVTVEAEPCPAGR